LWKSVFLNSSYLSQLNKRSCGKYIQTLLLRNHFNVYAFTMTSYLLWRIILACNFACPKPVLMQILQICPTLF
jgi:hypothetical protein